MKDNYIEYQYKNLLDKNLISNTFVYSKVKNIELSYFKDNNQYFYKPYLFKIGSFKVFKNIYFDGCEYMNSKNVINKINLNYKHKYYYEFDGDFSNKCLIIICNPYIKINFIDKTYLKLYFDGNTEADEIYNLLTDDINNNVPYFCLNNIIKHCQEKFSDKQHIYQDERNDYIGLMIVKYKLLK